MPYSKDQRTQIFAEEIVKGSNQTDAYLKAYPNAKSMKRDTIWKRASEFAKLSQVTGRINDLRVKASEKFEIDVDRILRGYTAIAFNDPAKMYDSQGNMKSIHEIPEEIRMTFNVIENGSMNRIKWVDGEQVTEPIAYIRRVRQQDRQKALDKLLDFAQDKLTKPPEGKDRGEVDTKQLARRILKLVHDAATGK